MDIKIFSSYREQDNFIIYWQQCPDYFINWFVKKFADGILSYEKRNFDVSRPVFKDLSDFLDSKPSAFSIARFFNVEIDIVTEWDIKNFFRNLNKDIDRLFKRKMICMIVDKTTNKEILISRLKFQISEDITEMSKSVIAEKTINGKIVYVGKSSIDNGYGEKERYLHESEYFLELSIRIFGVPLEHDTIVIDIRPEFLKKYNCQRVTETNLKDFSDKNHGKKIDMPLSYHQSADGWKWGFTITDKNKILDQLEF